MARVALVTGGTRGIGASICKALKAAGYTVAANYAGNDEAAQKFKTESGIPVYKWDVSSFEACSEGIKKVEAELGPIDVLINNAAIYPSRPFEEYSDDEQARVHRVNVGAAVQLARAVLPGMRRQQWGRIINVTSITLSGGWEHLQPYVQSKGAMLGNTRALAREFGKWGITVNAISPGAFPTDAEKIHPDPEGYRRMVLDRQSVKRRGHPGDIAAAILFLASDEAGFISGQNLAVDGGWIMH